MKNGAAKAGEAAYRQWNRRNCKHQTAALRPIPDALWGNKKYVNMKHLEAAAEDASIAG